MKDTSPHKPLPDEGLVDRAKAGELEAMDQLVSRHHGSVYRVAFGILRDEDGAADVAQETFLKAMRGLKGFRGDASFKTWLLTIAANEARGLLRKAGRRKELALETVGPVPSTEASVDDTMDIAEDVSRVMEVLSDLPEKQKQAVTLRIFEELSFREIGAMIGSSEGAARVNYHHGIRRLREMLG
ncbi:MAG: RNA polymerase sigma factor [Gemmatimonadota bacterium]